MTASTIVHVCLSQGSCTDIQQHHQCYGKCLSCPDNLHQSCTGHVDIHVILMGTDLFLNDGIDVLQGLIRGSCLFLIGLKTGQPYSDCLVLTSSVVAKDVQHE